MRQLPKGAAVPEAGRQLFKGILALRMGMRPTLIVATLGKASQRRSVLLAMARAGMDIARVNFSHENEKTHGERIRLVRRLNEGDGTGITIMLDLKGPEVRIWAGEERDLRKGERVLLSPRSGPGRIRLSNPAMLKKLEMGARVLVDDGTAELQVVGKPGGELECVALEDCSLKPRKSVNAEFLSLGEKAVTPEDREAIRWGMKRGVEYIAVSHV